MEASSRGGVILMDLYHVDLIIQCAHQYTRGKTDRGLGRLIHGIEEPGAGGPVDLVLHCRQHRLQGKYRWNRLNERPGLSWIYATPKG